MQQFGEMYDGLQIHTSKQIAAGMVHAYPFVVGHQLLEPLAEQRSEPSSRQLADDTSIDSLQHAANWETVVSYLNKIGEDNLFDYVPMLDRGGS